MFQQADAFRQRLKAMRLKADIVMHYRDGTFSQPFDDALRDAEMKVQKTAFRSPNTVGYVERFIQSLQQQVLDYFTVFGEQQMDHIASEALSASPTHGLRDDRHTVFASSERTTLALAETPLAGRLCP